MYDPGEFYTIKNVDGLVDFQLHKPLEHVRHAGCEQWNIADHKKAVPALKDTALGFFSVIVISQWLREDLWEDPKYRTIKHEHWVSRAIQEARRSLTNKYTDAKELIEKFELPIRAGNNTSEEEDTEFRIKVEDRVYEAQEVLEAVKQWVAYRKGYEAEWEEENTPEEEREAEWEADILAEFMPQVGATCDRVYDGMPDPFNWWDYRNSFQQYYFICFGDEIHYCHGGSGSSQQREVMGRWAHIFATLADQGVQIPTYCFEYNEVNEFRWLEYHNTFKCMNRELSGNYPGDRTEMKTLFKGKALHLAQDKDKDKDKDDWFGRYYLEPVENEENIW